MASTTTPQGKSQATLSELYSAYMRRVSLPIAGVAIRLGFTENGLTAAGLAITVLAAVAIYAQVSGLVVGLALIFGASFDSIDGSVARVRGTSTVVGGLFDSYADHIGEALVLTAIGLAADAQTARLLIVALATTALVSYVKPLASERGVTGIDWRGAMVAGHATRVLILTAGFLAGALSGMPVGAMQVSLALITIVNLIGVPYRIALTVRRAYSTTSVAPVPAHAPSTTAESETNSIDDGQDSNAPVVEWRSLRRTKHAAHDGIGGVESALVELPGSAHSRIELVEYVVVPPGVTIGSHPHGDDEELYLILSGSAIVSVLGQSRAVHGGHLVHNRPRGTHALMNNGSVDVTMIVIQVEARQGTSDD